MRRRRRAVGFYTKGRGRGRKVIPITARSGGARRRVIYQKNAPIAAPPLHEETMKKIIEYDSSEPFTRDEPFTKEQVEGFNRYTHFPSDINKEFREDVTAVEKEAVDTLKKHGITTIPPDVKTSLWYYRKAVYNYYLESSRARSIAPPPSVVGPSKYPLHRIPRSEKIRERALDQVETSKTYLQRALGRHTKGKPETSEIEKWLPLAQKAGSRVKFGKLYAEQIRKAAQEKTEKTGWDQQLASGNWDHVSRQRGRELYDKIIGSSTASNPSGPAQIKTARPKLAVGKKIELETPKGFVKGEITGFRSGDVGEEFQRIDVKTDERVYIGVHPDSVYPSPKNPTSETHRHWMATDKWWENIEHPAHQPHFDIRSKVRHDLETDELQRWAKRRGLKLTDATYELYERKLKAGLESQKKRFTPTDPTHTALETRVISRAKVLQRKNPNWSAHGCLEEAIAEESTLEVKPGVYKSVPISEQKELLALKEKYDDYRRMGKIDGFGKLGKRG